MELPPPVASYYRAVDAPDMTALRETLDPEFTQYRPDRTIEGRDRFVEFMRDDRPRTDTVHDLLESYSGQQGVAVRGRLTIESGHELLEFVDVFAVDRQRERLRSLWTYTQ